jgi:uncharacterized membrane protein YraQ (UPF0718 family)
MNLIKRFKFSLILAVVMLGLYFYNQTTGVKAFDITLDNIGEMLSILPAIFIFVGLLDVWVPKETMVKFMGKESGFKGILIALFLGSAAAGPLYAAFPIATLLLQKGARLAYVIFFLGAWSSTKIPFILFESANLGLKFTAIHIGVSIPSYLLIAYLIEKVTSKEAIVTLYEKTQVKV